MISLRGVSLVYPNGVRALDNVSLEIAKGDFVFLVGHSGTGKSSLLALALSRSGRDRRRDHRRRHSRRHACAAVASPRYGDISASSSKTSNCSTDKTVWENVAFAMQVTGAHTQRRQATGPARARSRRPLAQEPHVSRRALGRRTAAHRDRSRARQQSEDSALRRADGKSRSVNTTEIMELLARINLKGTTVVVATHNQAVVDRMRRRVVRLEDGTHRHRRRARLLLSWTGARSSSFWVRCCAISRATPACRSRRSARSPSRSSCWALFLFVRAALAGVGTKLLDQIEVSAYLQRRRDARADTQRSRRYLAHDPRIASARVRLEEARSRRAARAQTHGVIDTSLLTENPLPDKFRIKVSRARATLPAVAAERAAPRRRRQRRLRPNVIERLLQLGDVLRRVGIGVIVVFLVVAGIIISNTIRLTVFARRREIAIMQLVGATNMYIRVAVHLRRAARRRHRRAARLAVLAVARAALWPRLLEALPWVQLAAMAGRRAPALRQNCLAVGAAIGAIASWISVGRHLRV